MPMIVFAESWFDRRFLNLSLSKRTQAAFPAKCKPLSRQADAKRHHWSGCGAWIAQSDRCSWVDRWPFQSKVPLLKRILSIMRNLGSRLLWSLVNSSTPWPIRNLKSLLLRLPWSPMKPFTISKATPWWSTPPRVKQTFSSLPLL